MCFTAYLPDGYPLCRAVGHSWVLVWGILICPMCYCVLLLSPP